jgi:hypothetical protein
MTVNRGEPPLDLADGRGNLQAEGKSMKHVVAYTGLASLALFACSSAPPGDPGVKGPTIIQNCAATDMNGYQVCYPTSDIGTTARAGTVAGSRIANFAFSGYTTTDTAKIDTTTAKTQTIRLSDFFDPMQKGVTGIIGGKPIKIIHLTVAALWCGPCNEETDFISGANYTGYNTAGAAFATELAPLGVVFVQAIDDGATPGIGATITDLNTWIGRHNNDFYTMVDPSNSNLGIFFDAAAIPFNMNIDARSMEILSADVGFDTQMDQTIKSKWLTWVAANPPSY